MNTLKVLIVEHADSGRSVVRQLLADYELEFQWRHAASPRELENIAEEFAPGIVYCADDMPEAARRGAFDTLRLLSPWATQVLVVEVGDESQAAPPIDEPGPADDLFELSDAWDRPAATWRNGLPSILQAGRDAVALGDSAGWITYANVQACRLLEEASERPLATLLAGAGDAPSGDGQNQASPRLAHVDPYTAEPTPVHASELAARVLACARGDYSTMPLMALNLRGLRSMNENRGTEWGDKVLDIVMSQLRSGIADCGLVAPLSEDDVLFVLPPPTHPADAVTSVRTDIGAPLQPLREEEIADTQDTQNGPAPHALGTGATPPYVSDDIPWINPNDVLSVDDDIPWVESGTVASPAGEVPWVRLDHAPREGADIPWVDPGEVPLMGSDIPWAAGARPHDEGLDMSASAVNDTHVFRSALAMSPETPRSAVEAGLDEALRRHSMGVHYQPQYELDGGRGCGVEALCRWFLTSGDPIAPAVFIPVAERTGRVGALGAYVLKNACETAAGWKGRDAQRLTLSVNVSTLQINSEFTEVMVDTLKNCGLPAERLELEIAEAAMLAGDASIDRCLKSWKDLGVRIAVNHAGDNYSNLRCLTKLRVDRLKLDKRLIHGMTSQPKSAAMVNALISLGANLGIDVMAEGVETEEQFEMLMRLRCPQAQGYLFGRPMPLAQTLVVLRKPWGNLPRSVRRPAPNVAAQFAS